MSGFYGADTDALRNLSERFQSGGHELAELRTSLSSAVMTESIWTGSDADAFREDWASRISQSFVSITDLLAARRDELERHAQEQDDASRNEGHGTSLWDRLQQVVGVGAKALSLYKAGKSLLDDAKDMKRLWDARKMGPEDFERVWESLKLRNKLKWASGGFGKLFSTLGGQVGKGVPGSVWSWLGGKVDDVPRHLAEGGRLVDKIASKLGPKGMERLMSAGKSLGKGSKMLGKFLPGVDIAVGAWQLNSATDGYGKVSGALSMASGALVLAGVAFPPLAVVGGVLGAVSLGMDLVDLGGELFGHDPSKAVSEAVSHGAEAVSHAVSSGVSTAGKALGNVGSGIKHGLGSIFG